MSAGLRLSQISLLGNGPRHAARSALKKLKARYQRDYQGANKEKISERREEVPRGQQREDC